MTDKTAFVLWLTGLSGSGKSVIAEGVLAELVKRGLPVEHLDGDALRRVFPETGFSRAERDHHVRRVAHAASLLEKHGVRVVVSLISPYVEGRSFARGLCANFIEVHVSTPLEVCEKRDPKGLYALARRGEKPHFTGIHDPYEPPTACELAIDTTSLPPEASVGRMMAYLEERRLCRPA